ncbi:hypothetical protein GH714_019618 [Hevea brasiliensis]|uniref:Uncharacterized protein n=1 Tax=Hevea brasiliensis TaxID=3981 RepID=A0A6A6MBJ4_HEVBR|nr:hypothetical protein GH714_019618 [Hevea brasiliensis]
MPHWYCPSDTWQSALADREVLLRRTSLQVAGSNILPIDAKIDFKVGNSLSACCFYVITSAESVEGYLAIEISLEGRESVVAGITSVTLQRRISSLVPSCLFYGRDETFLHLCRDCMALSSVRSNMGLGQRWTLLVLLRAQVELNLNARIVGNCLISFGVVFRDVSGAILTSASKIVEGSWDMVVTEGLWLTIDLSFYRLVAESDCKSLIDQLSNGECFHASLGVALQDCFS